MAVESLCFIDGVGDPSYCYKTLETITIMPEPTGIPGLTACLYDDSDSEDCEPYLGPMEGLSFVTIATEPEPYPGPMQGLSFVTIATELPFSPVDNIPDPQGIVNPEEGLLKK